MNGNNFPTLQLSIDHCPLHLNIRVLSRFFEMSEITEIDAEEDKACDFEGALLPVNFRENQDRLESLAGFLKNFGTRRIVLMHVVSSGLTHTGHAGDRLEKLRKRIGRIIPKTECLIRSGSPALEICQAAEGLRLRFISIPWKKKDFLQKTLLGSTTQDVVRLSNLPVFVHKEGTFEDSPGHLRNILYAANFDLSHERIIEYLRVRDMKARNLCVVHAGERAPDPESEKQRKESVFKELNELILRCSDYFETVKPVSTVGNPKREILRTAKQFGADVIVMGKHSQGSPLENILGSTAESITYRARCSVLIVPASFNTTVENHV